MASTSPDPAQCATRLRNSVALLSRQLRSGSATPEGPSVAKLSVLGQLHRHGPNTSTALAALERVKPQSLTRLLAELEAEDWIARAPHPSDGRQSVLSLTPEGTKRLKAIMRSRESALTEAIGATLDAEQRAVLLQACELIDGLSATLALLDASGATKP
ncbi:MULTISPECIES: MarR family winged helix-turn-helix transcriptional regulator [Variovorax]|jgi:DNA-binding MarR family transcriptional regulator|uniref:MarR family winged helix-turn-helix transcriptional regulator n=1 Tax=Variovorax TaxID=34072 RepID=UPI00086B0547|nr:MULTISPECIES: MarR family transcriptional regulator [Variovorax]MBN8756874.1 MarR family transcriptional regulator [Variovorax sp.]ODU17091.1 MAG: MarR family transcriptional regulator [Variovorax sp. SCN 67-85]ODV21602.1 MAG: MarR family transcriptional regulator [Variovorax sp. SCN 67-20]OJZ14734.1 MAG: MarR family transcriptional regulator [Variovorax sp. 67-131]UKI07063.1 MarR family transcriptional regulator [Variovorax paradoxus]